MSNNQALIAARKVWHEHNQTEWDDHAFEVAVSAYMQTLASGLVKPKAPAPKADAPHTRNLKEHFMAMASGHYEGYTMTPGRTGSVGREVICYQPNPKSSVLLPLFMSVHDVHDALTDTQGRKLDVEIVQ